MTPEHLLSKYWDGCQANGHKPKPVYACVWRGVAQDQPAGTIETWSVNRREMAKRVTEYPSLKRLVRITTET